MVWNKRREVLGFSLTLHFSKFCRLIELLQSLLASICRKGCTDKTNTKTKIETQAEPLNIYGNDKRNLSIWSNDQMIRNKSLKNNWSGTSICKKKSFTKREFAEKMVGWGGNSWHLPSKIVKLFGTTIWNRFA